MRCDVCCRPIRTPYAHSVYDCANWPEVHIGQTEVEYRGYLMSQPNNLGFIRITKEGEYVNSVNWWPEAFMFIERN